MHEGFWIVDPDTEESVFYTYDQLAELDDEIIKAITKPIGGFIYPADMYMAMPVAPNPFYIQNWLPKRGKAVLYAPPKSGKSALAVQCARCIGSGESILGMETTKGEVLYIQNELSLQTLQARLKGTKQTYSGVYVGCSFAMKLDDTGGQKMLMTAIEAVEPNVLILDALYKMIKGDENVAHDMLVVTDFLDDLIEAYGCSILVIHHSGKDPNRGARGSSVLDDWVDSSIEIKRISQPGEALTIRATPKFLRHAELPPEPIIAELIDFEFQQKGERKRLLEIILGTLTPEGVTIPELMQITEASRSGVNKALEHLIVQKLVHRIDRGRYAKTLLIPKEKTNDGTGGV